MHACFRLLLLNWALGSFLALLFCHFCFYFVPLFIALQIKAEGMKQRGKTFDHLMEICDVRFYVVVFSLTTFTYKEETNA